MFRLQFCTVFYVQMLALESSECVELVSRNVCVQSIFLKCSVCLDSIGQSYEILMIRIQFQKGLYVHSLFLVSPECFKFISRKICMSTFHFLEVRYVQSLIPETSVCLDSDSRKLHMCRLQLQNILYIYRVQFQNVMYAESVVLESQVQILVYMVKQYDLE